MTEYEVTIIKVYSVRVEANSKNWASRRAIEEYEESDMHSMSVESIKEVD